MIARIKDYMVRVIHSHHLVGVALGVVQDCQPYIEVGFGMKNLESREPVTADSLFHLASISKLFVATAVMQLVEKGRITLDAPLEKVLPYMQIKDPSGRQITIRHMLSHTSGFPDVSDYQWGATEDDDAALERYVRQLEIELISEPGKRFFYSNMAYEVLGHLVARIAEMSFEEYVRENILNRLEMSSSTHFRKNVPSDLAVGAHTIDLGTHAAGIYPYNRAHSPSSTLHSSAREMNRWAVANLQREKNGNRAILQPSTYDEMWKPCAGVPIPGRPGKHVGLGWFMDDHRGVRFLYHSGNDVGFSTYFLLVPERSIGITILCNAAPAPADKLAFGILDILLGVEPAVLKPSVMIPLGAVYAEKGSEAMQATHAQLNKEAADEYDFGMGGFLDVSSSLLDENKNAQAIDMLTFALRLFPDSADGYESLARAFFQSGDFEQAKSAALRSLEIEPDNLFLRAQIKPLLGS